MVENTNENSHDSDTPKSTLRKLFGGRRSHKPAHDSTQKSEEQSGQSTRAAQLHSDVSRRDGNENSNETVAENTKHPSLLKRGSASLIFQAPDPQLFSQPERNKKNEESVVTEESKSPSRKRIRKRQNSETSSSQDTVSQVSLPPKKNQVIITEPQKVRGSTRLEAKKLRRREGRDTDRRRTIITEAEFLARRESVERSMIVRSRNKLIQIAVLEDGILVEHYVAKTLDASLIGNVYLGRVQNVLPSMEAAFVDIGRGRNAVLYSGEVDWDSAKTGQNPKRIEFALKAGDSVLVQVTKDPVGHKGARLTSQVSLPGRYLVYVPNGSMNGISRKLPDTERSRLKKILKEVLPENVSVIVRTAAEGTTHEQLTLDVERLKSQWDTISSQANSTKGPLLLHSEPDLLIKIIRDVFNEDFQKLIVEGDDIANTITNYLHAVAPDLVDRLEVLPSTNESFTAYRVDEQIEKALERKVWLPSGGSLVIDRTEAMTVIDVNTGKFVGSGGNLEETVTKNNLEAAEEIVRQLRLRDIGGIIVVDFIDMVLESNRDLVLRRLLECLSRDRTKHQVAEVTSLGLVQMTRKKLGLGLLESFSEPCDVCAGRGIIVSTGSTKTKSSHSPKKNVRTISQSSLHNSESATKSNGTHAITEGAKVALAQIAASTIASAHNHVITPKDVPDTLESVQKPRRAQRKKTETPLPTVRSADDSLSVKSSTPFLSVGSSENSSRNTNGFLAASDDDEIQILDIPLKRTKNRQAKMSQVDAEQLLDSVLDSLPPATQKNVSTSPDGTAMGAKTPVKRRRATSADIESNPKIF